MTDRPDFPVTDDVLTHVEHALDARLSYDGCAEGEGPKVEGAEFTMGTLLDFYSGYDPDQSLPETTDDDTPVHVYYGPPLFTRDDVIRALIAEVRRLRTTLDAAQDGTR